MGLRTVGILTPRSRVSVMEAQGPFPQPRALTCPTPLDEASFLGTMSPGRVSG